MFNFKLHGHPLVNTVILLSAPGPVLGFSPLFVCKPTSHKAFSVNWLLDAFWAPFYSVPKWVEVGRSGLFWVFRCHSSGVIRGITKKCFVERTPSIWTPRGDSRCPPGIVTVYWSLVAASLKRP